MKQLQEDIKTQNFKQTYLLFGEERYLKVQYKQKLLQALECEEGSMNFSRFEGKDIDVSEIISLCETMPFFAEHRVILVEDSGFFKNKCDELADYFKELPDYAVMVFAESEVDRRSRMYKAVNKIGRAIEFKMQEESTLKTWAGGILKKEGLRITSRDMDFLLSRTGTDMGTIRMELDKLIAYTAGRNVVTEQDIREICSVRLEDKIFQMMRAVTEHKQKQALALYYDLLALKEPAQKILLMLSRQFSQLFYVKKMTEEGLSQKEIAAKLGIQEFAVRNHANCARSYTESQLIRIQEDFAETDEAVKSGRLKDTLSVELMIIRYSS